MSTKRRRSHRRAVSPGRGHLTVANIVEALGLAFDLPSAVGGFEEAIVLVDARHRVVRMILDPLIPESHRLWVPRSRPAQRGDERILHIVVRGEVGDGPPSDEEVDSYERLKQVYRNTGHELLDILLTDGERVRSMSLALDDPASPWHDVPEAS